jgi:hypothetical protein
MIRLSGARCLAMSMVGAIATMLLISCGDSAGPDQDALPEPGTSGPEFVTMTRDGVPWEPETSSLFMIGTIASFGWDRYVAGTPKREGMGVSLHPFAGVGDYVLSAPSTESHGFYGVSDTSTGTAVGFPTTSDHPGHARISGFDPADSTIAGNFRFDIFYPDGTKTSFAGSFRLRHRYCC